MNQKKSPAPKRRKKLFTPLRLTLPADTGLAGLEVFDDLCGQLAPLMREGGTLTPRLQVRREALLGHVHSGGKLVEALSESGDVRVVLSLWREDADFLRVAPPDKAVVQRLQHLLPLPSRTLWWQLTRLYLEHYDTLPGYRELAGWLGDSLAKLPKRSNETPELRACREQRKGLFSKDAPAALLRYAGRKQRGFFQAARDWALPHTSRIHIMACRRYYLEPLAKLRPGQEHPLFEELLRAEVHEQAMPDSSLLGHHVCRVLMDHVLASEEPLPRNWRQLILGIMGDPRVPRSAPQFQTWWSRLEKRYVQAMRQWLSSLDLALFLDILEEVARTHGKEDLLRMFPARKRFLEGLHHLGLIKASRLLLGTQAEKYIRKHFDLRDLPEFASLGISDASLIYLNLGNAHFLEGTHAFQARLYHLLPIPGLADYETEKFQLSELRKYPADYTFRHARGNFPRWQHELMETLSLAPFNIQIEPRAVLSEEDYAAYRQVY